MKGGYIKMPRSLFDTFKMGCPASEWEAFAWLVSECNYEGEHRGSVKVSERALAEKFGWGRKKVRVFLEKIEEKGLGAQLGAQRGGRIYIKNFDTYSGSGPKEGPKEGPNEGGTLSTKKKGRKDPTDPKRLLPEEVEALAPSHWCEDAKQALRLWAEYKKKNREPMFRESWEALLRKWETTQFAFVDSVQQSLGNGWKGLFEVKEKAAEKSWPQKSKAEIDRDNTARILQEFMSHEQ